MLRALLFIFISEQIWDHPEMCVCIFKDPPLSSSLFFSLRNEIFIRTISVFGRLSLNSFVSESAICTRRPLIFRGPICGTHGTLSRLRSKCWQRSRRGDKNTLQCRLHSEGFPSLFPPKSVSSSVQTELNQQLHTPDAPSIGPGTFCWAGGGATSEGLMFQRNRTPQWTSRLFWAPRSCVTSHPVAFMPCEVQWTEPGNIYSSLVFVNSSDWKQHITHSKELSANKGAD